MKKKLAGGLTVFAVMFLLCAALVSAAGYTPGAVKGARAASVGETSFTLKWNKVSKATGYYVYRVSGQSLKRVATVKSTSYKVTKLKPGKTYKYQVAAYRKVKGKTYVSDAYSDVVKVSPTVNKPSVPGSFEVGAYGSRTLQLTWNKVSNASGYQIFLYDTEKKTYKKVKTCGKNAKSCKLSGLTVNKEYTYVIRSYRKVGSSTAYSSYSKKVTGIPIKVSSKVSSVRSCYFYVTTNKKIKVYNYKKKKNQTLAAGTRLISPFKHPSDTYTNVYLTNGQKIKIKTSALNATTGIQFDGNFDYSKRVKEAFVNSRNIRSETKYLVWISQYTARVNIFKGSAGKWKLVKTFRCGLGLRGSPKGTYKIYAKNRWSYEGLPMIYWYLINSFHSMLGASVGQASSEGCIRCPADGLMYLYNTVPMNSTVYSY